MAKKNEIAKVDTAAIQPVEQIESLILTIRGKQVMLDRDLARLYGVETFRLNEQVKRNIERFPEDFMFQLSKEEWKEISSQFAITSVEGKVLRSQIASIKTEGEVLSSQNASIDMRGRHVKYMPYAFTESGIAMLSGVLRSPQAVSMNIQIMRAFVAMRRFLASNAQVFQRLEVIEHTQLSLVAHQEVTDKKLEEVFRRLDEGAAAPKEAIFFDGEFFEARVLLEKLIKMAKKRVIIIDGYIDAATFDMLDVRAKGVTADIYSDGEHKSLRDAHNASKGKQPINTHKWSNSSHDRWIIVDDTLYHCGHSVKDLGKKLSAIMRMDWNPDVVLNAVR